MNKEGKKYIIKGVAYLVLGAIYIFCIFRLGIPLAVKVADLIQKDKGSLAENESIVFPPRFNYLPTATNSAQLVVSGFGIPNQKVSIYLNNNQEKIIDADADGLFSSSINLILGKNEIYGKNIDPEGKESEPSTSMNVSYFDIAPEVTITEPIDGASIRQKDNVIDVKGVSEPGITIKVNSHLAIVDNNGNFTYRFGLSEGENQITVEAIDSAGNIGSKQIKVTFRKR